MCVCLCMHVHVDVNVSVYLEVLNGDKVGKARQDIFNLEQ